MSSQPDPECIALVVDDEPLIRMVAVDMLSEKGCFAYEAGDGPEALALLADHPDIVLMITDINMPGTPDGLGLACEARERRPDLSIVVTSGRVRPAPDELPTRGRFISKPYSSHDLFSAIAASGGERLAQWT